MGRRVMQRPFYCCWGSGKLPPCSVCGIKACIILLGEVQFRVALITDVSAAAGTCFQEVGGVAFDVSRTGYACRNAFCLQTGCKQVARTCYTVIGFLGSSRQYCRARS